MQKPAQSFKLILLVAAIFLTSCSNEKNYKTPLQPNSEVYYSDPVDYINSIRLDSRLNQLKPNQILSHSAQNHAKYTFINKVQSHDEQEGMPAFSGKTPTDRAQNVGYFSGASENISINSKSQIESVSGLMSAIYHRFAFLDPSIDEIGYGTFGDKDRVNLTYNMGNSQINEFCKRGVSDSGYGKFYTGACKQKEISISENRFNNYKDLNFNEYTYYPNSENTKAFFSSEIPDPIPECKITANPISIEFSSYKKAVSMVSFKVFDGEDELKDTKILTSENDVNSIFNKFQFALFSKEVFKFNHSYRAEFEYIQDSKTKKVAWDFKTSTPKYQYFIAKNGDVLGLEPDIWYDVFFYPDNCNDVFKKYSMSYRFMSKPAIDTIDTNSIRVKLSGVKNAYVTLETDNGKKIKMFLLNSSESLSIFDYKGYIFGFFVVIFAIFYTIIKRRR
ncbi:CAP domain-containing protein [Campylobacter geochelonis]|uniref:Periplasmic protein n=1 Tax=Campylobacter geochelonis TaxID=1780362 RepID=A0A128ED78_9BACT|nr:CAP domain-containing protein [Campylobacter geochelonis]QKF70902.1 CAP domain-containing protein [Campylobacter geochelonis]CZE46926.1 periplasmic protein [Campylobacter geochelonis]